MRDEPDVDSPPPKPLVWIASTRKDMRGFPKEVRVTFGQALFDAQVGRRHPNAKTLKGFGGASVIELVEDLVGNTYRAVYTVRFAKVVFVLHMFQKKSKSGRKTPQADIQLIRDRLRQAEDHYEKWIKE